MRRPVSSIKKCNVKDGQRLPVFSRSNIISPVTSRTPFFSFLHNDGSNIGRRRVARLIVIILLTLVILFTSLTVPKICAEILRGLLMSRPAFLYGTPINWNEVKGCLSSTHQQEAQQFLNSNSNNLKNYLPLNPDVVWNWNRYSTITMETNQTSSFSSSSGYGMVEEINTPRRRLLIAQYSGKGSYLQMLKEVEPINRAYARKWGHDYVTLVGTALKFPGFLYDDSDNRDRADRTHCSHYSATDTTDKNKSYYYESQSTFNKIALLFRALEESPQKYDQLLILDTDTMIVDLDYDITSLLLSKVSPSRSNGINKGRKDEPSENNTPFHPNKNVHTKDNDGPFLVAHRVDSYFISNWNINAGITLWNLQHEMVQIVAKDWLKSSLSHPVDVLLKNDDQYFLQLSLKKAINTVGFDCSWWEVLSVLPFVSNYCEFEAGHGINSILNEFNYYDATVIKHFKRDAKSWTHTGLEQRLLRIQETKTDICRKWPDDCRLETT